MVRDPCKNRIIRVNSVPDVRHSNQLCGRAFVPSEVRHFHHDHAHVLRQENDVVASIVPFGHFRIECHFFLPEQFNLLGDFLFVLFGHLAHGLACSGDAANVRILVDSAFAGVSAR